MQSISRGQLLFLVFRDIWLGVARRAGTKPLFTHGTCFPFLSKAAPEAYGRTGATRMKLGREPVTAASPSPRREGVDLAPWKGA